MSDASCGSIAWLTAVEARRSAMIRSSEALPIVPVRVVTQHRAEVVERRVTRTEGPRLARHRAGPLASGRFLGPCKNRQSPLNGRDLHWSACVVPSWKDDRAHLRAIQLA